MRFCEIEDPRQQSGPRLTEVREALTCGFAVGVTGFRLNSALRSYLRGRAGAAERGESPAPAQPGSPPVAHRRRVRDRLSEHDLSMLVESFRNGTPAHVLAKRYGIGETSVKAVLRQRGVRRTAAQPPHSDEHQTG